MLNTDFILLYFIVFFSFSTIHNYMDNVQWILQRIKSKIREIFKMSLMPSRWKLFVKSYYIFEGWIFIDFYFCARHSNHSHSQNSKHKLSFMFSLSLSFLITMHRVCNSIFWLPIFLAFDIVLIVHHIYFINRIVQCACVLYATNKHSMYLSGVSMKFFFEYIGETHPTFSVCCVIKRSY